MEFETLADWEWANIPNRGIDNPEEILIAIEEEEEEEYNL